MYDAPFLANTEQNTTQSCPSNEEYLQVGFTLRLLTLPGIPTEAAFKILNYLGNTELTPMWVEAHPEIDDIVYYIARKKIEDLTGTIYMSNQVYIHTILEYTSQLRNSVQLIAVLPKKLQNLIATLSNHLRH